MNRAARILIVDDETDVREVFARQLSRLGHTCAKAADGTVALQMLVEDDYDVVLTDLVMPNMDGMALIAAMREAGTDAVPVVISGHGNVATAVSALKQGAFDFVEKDPSADILESVVERAANHRRLRQRADQMTEIAQSWEKTFDAVPDLVAVIDENHRLVRVNRAMAQAIGCTAEEAVGRKCFECIHGTSEPPEYCPHAKSLQDNDGHSAEIFEGFLERNLLITTSPLRDAVDKVCGTVHVARDMTEYSHAQESLREAHGRESILNSILRTSLENRPLGSVLEHALKLIVTAPGLGIEPKGAVFLVDDGGESISLTVHRGLHPALLESCARLHVGQCLCGRAAASGEVQYADHIDPRHTVRFDGMAEHGHYCVPMHAGDEVIGVLSLYMQAGLARDKKSERFLLAVADILAGIVVRDKGEAALRQSEATLKAITGATQDAILMMDEQGLISFYNPAAEAIFGWTRDEAIGNDMHSLLAPERYRPAYEARLPEFRQSGKGPAVGKTLELMGRRKDGSEFPVEISLSSVRQHDAWHAVGIMRDITKRKQAERALLQSEERYKALFECSSDAIMTLEPPSWRFTSGNPACLKMFGANSADEFKSLGPWDVSPEHQPDGRLSAEQAKQMIETAIRGGSHWFDWRHLRLDGEEFDATILLTRVELGDRAFLQATVRDVTKRRQMENQLRASEEKFRQIVDNVGLGVSLIGTDMRIIEMNRQMREWFPDIRAEEKPICYRAFNDPPEEAPCSYCPTVKTLASGKVNEANTSTPHNGGVRNYRVVSSPIHDHDGQVVGAIEMVDDVTERLRLEQELSQAQKLEAVGRLAAGIAHEINTPTQYVGDNIEFLQIAYESLVGLIAVLPRMVDTAATDAVSPEMISEARELIESANLDYLAEQIPRAIEQSIEGVGRISSIVQAMKEFSHPGSSEKTQVDLNQCIRSTVTVSRNEWKYVADLDLDLDDTLPHVLCLPGEFNQVILNMIVNAAHAVTDVVGDGTKQKGTITISTRRNGKFAEVRISDTGAGIPHDVQSRIFEPFFTTKGVGRGTGQGLAIARNVIVDKHGGDIAVESEIGKGTSLFVRLPIEPASSTSEPVDSHEGNPQATAQ
jgi:PAS domain S-box-containing protein